MAINPTFNPAQVMLNQGQGQGKINGPYLNPKPVGGPPDSPFKKAPFLNPQPIQGGQMGGGGWKGPQQAPQPQQPGIVRATGTGPYDAAYRQNLATYSGGLFNRPGGVLSFNPTDPNSLQGRPTGGGNAPVQGLPTSLLAQALGQSQLPQGSYTQPQPSQTSTSNTAPLSNPNIQNWLRNFMQRYMYQGNQQ